MLDLQTLNPSTYSQAPIQVVFTVTQLDLHSHSHNHRNNTPPLHYHRSHSLLQSRTKCGTAKRPNSCTISIYIQYSSSTIAFLTSSRLSRPNPQYSAPYLFTLQKPINDANEGLLYPRMVFNAFPPWSSTSLKHGMCYS